MDTSLNGVSRVAPLLARRSCESREPKTRRVDSPNRNGTGTVRPLCVPPPPPPPPLSHTLLLLLLLPSPEVSLRLSFSVSSSLRSSYRSSSSPSLLSLCTANEQRARFRDAAKGATSSSTSPRGRYHPASRNRGGEKEGHFGRMREKRARKEEREREKEGWEGQTLASLNGGEGWTAR